MGRQIVWSTLIVTHTDFRPQMTIKTKWEWHLCSPTSILQTRFTQPRFDRNKKPLLSWGATCSASAGSWFYWIRMTMVIGSTIYIYIHVCIHNHSIIEIDGQHKQHICEIRSAHLPAVAEILTKIQIWNSKLKKYPHTLQPVVCVGNSARSGKP